MQATNWARVLALDGHTQRMPPSFRISHYGGPP